MGRTYVLAFIIALVWIVQSFAGDSYSSRQVSPQLIITVGEIQVFERSDRVAIPIYFDNYSDAIAGFTLVLESDRPDILKFRAGGIDSVLQALYWKCWDWENDTCSVSSIVSDTTLGYDFVTYEYVSVTDAGFDAVGTLVENWEFVASRDLAGDNSRVKITALADVLGPPATPDLATQTGGTLIYILADIAELPLDTAFLTVRLSLSNDLLETGFSDPVGNLLGLKVDSVLDTTYWRCEEFDSTAMLCLSFRQITEPPYEPYDSLVALWNRFVSWDSSYALSLDGFANVLEHCCEVPGDANHDGRLSIADVTFGIQYLFASGPAPFCLDESDANSDDRFSIADITFSIGRIFSGGPAPSCGQTGS